MPYPRQRELRREKHATVKPTGTTFIASGRLPALGVAAQSLHFLNDRIAEPIKAAALYRSGVLVEIPRPEAYAIHKLIVAKLAAL